MRFSILAALLSLTACTTESTSGSDAGRADAANLDAAVDAAPICTVMRLTTVSGSIVDESGAPIEGALAQFCVHLEDGGASCIMPTAADATGVFHVAVPPDVSCIVSGAIRAFFPDGLHADTYVHTEIASAAAGEITWTQPFVVYAVEPPDSLPAYGDGEAMRRVDFRDGLSLDVTPSALSIMRNYNELAARKVPLSPSAPAFMHDAPALLGLYALKQNSLVDAQFTIHIANDTHLAAGTRVALYVLGGIFTVLADGTQVNEADFQQYGMATVSADASEIVSDEGSALPFMTWLGYRVAE
ncbi:MAG: carboxypeptidase regulatory-like domain-containing protein [Sandaracinaceae bacterium]|nr:carboxypeptidase regulatory-like domain-containing protein [Sandaracinaceae bacterium]